MLVKMSTKKNNRLTSIKNMMRFYNIEVNNYNKMIYKVFEECKNLLKNRFVFMESKKFVYDNETILLIPNTEYYDCHNDDSSNYSQRKKCFIKQYPGKFNFEGFKLNFLTLDEHKKIFSNNINFPLKCMNGSESWFYCDSNKNHNHIISYVKSDNIVNARCICDDGTYNYAYVILPIHRLGKVDSSKLNDEYVFRLWLKNGLIPRDTKYSDEYTTLMNLSNKYGFDNEFKINTKKTINEIIIDKDKLKEETDKYDIDPNRLKKGLLECDKSRFDFLKYDEKILTDINRGHWELNINSSDDKTIEANLFEEMVYRNPLIDVRMGGAIGIDFGTKSTVVTYQDQSSEIRPMRVGVGDLSKESKGSDYENPTIMEFINIDKFISDYNSSKGRPKTSWHDITVSHTAFDKLKDSESVNYYAYFNQIKQWCANNQKRIRIKDTNNNKTVDLPSFLDIEEEFNPVEIYDLQYKLL
ncbi:MAG: hypothetical protein R3Y64_03970 [Peptostreptococcaceae bacterium]